MEDFGFTHLSAGDLLRSEVAKGTNQGKELEAMMKEGKLVPAVRLKIILCVLMLISQVGSDGRFAESCDVGKL